MIAQAITHVSFTLIISLFYLIPLLIIYFSINKWSRKKIAFPTIIYILINLIALTYLAIFIWATLITN